jgi:ABC-2 type transport system ATP-binding protein
MDIELKDVTLTYGRGAHEVCALRDVSLTVPGGTVLGVLGRNGAGKTTLMSLIAGYMRPTGGVVHVDGRDPYENAELASQIVYVGSPERANYWLSPADLMRLYAQRPNWDQAFANHLINAFELPPRRKLSKFSKGQKAAFWCIIGLASRAPVTMLDEVYIGMDAVYREVFVRELLGDLAAHPRTVLFSTHFISEMERLFTNALIVDKGRILLYDDADNLRVGGSSLSDTFIELTTSAAVGVAAGVAAGSTAALKEMA